MQRLACAMLLSLLVLWGANALTPAPTPTPDLVVVGDIHGDLFYYLATLHSTGVIDDEGHWKLGPATLVQVGDILDRGDDGRFIFDHLDQLRQEAEEVGGRVVQLLGNHEVMNLALDFRYVTNGDWDLFGGRTSRNIALGPEGVYGQRLRAFPLVVALNDTVVAHAGLPAAWARRGVAEVNRQAWAAIRAGRWEAPVLGGDGPTWTRDLINAALQGQCAPVTSALAALGEAEGRPFRRMVVGHTPLQGGAVRFLCEGALVDVDIAMSRGMGGGYFGALAVYHTAAGASDATALPVKRKLNRKVVGGLASRLIRDLRGRYLTEGLHPPIGLRDEF